MRDALLILWSLFTLELAAQHSARAIDVVTKTESDPRTVNTRRPRKRQTN